MIKRKENLTMDGIMETKKIKKRFFLAFLILAIMMIATEIFGQLSFGYDDESAITINLAGRQRMLSQKMTKEIYHFVLHPKEEKILIELGTSYQEWEKAHQKLSADQKNSEKIKELWKGIEGQYQSLKLVVEELLDQGSEASILDLNEEEYLESLSLAEEDYLAKMEELVDVYSLELEQGMKMFRLVELILFSVALIVLWVIVSVMFIPGYAHLEKVYHLISQSKDGMQDIFRMIKHPLFIVDQETKRISVFNGAAAQLLDKSMELYDLRFVDLIMKQVKNPEFLIEAMERKSSVFNYEIHITSNDTKKDMLLSKESFIYEGREACIISLVDVTEQKRASDEILYISEHDPLTGLRNRRAFDKRVEEEMNRVNRYHEPVSLIIADIDHFKHVNDKWGHPVGDKVLVETAKRLKDSLRSTDYIGRLGGEEFIILLPNTEGKEASLVAEKMRRCLEEVAYELVGKLTASFGVAQRYEAEDYIHWYKRTDRALYYAKETGRNKVANAEEIGNVPILSIHLEWNESMTSGDEGIDEQHAGLIDLGRQFIHQVFTSKNNEDFMHMFEQVISHAKEHFAYEEGVLQRVHYKEYEEHKQIHERLIKKAEKLKRECEEDYDHRIALVEYVVQDVIYQHLLQVDTRFFSAIEVAIRIPSADKENHPTE
ncbi:MAG: diguanylate cyclase [Vallitaleaceae bacterium]|nr:diguanylate cyclase [Vallitaleaceae bacterium]